MANTLYDFARQRFLEAQINWMTNTIKVLLVSTGAYTPQTAVHQYLSDIPTSARIAGPVTLTAKATTGGAADAADVGQVWQLRCGAAWCGKVGFGTVRCGAAWHGQVWQLRTGMAR